MSKIRILITTTSFQDTPGRHHDLLAGDAYDIERARGPLPESAILALVGDYDAILCGDDAFTRPVYKNACRASRYCPSMALAWTRWISRPPQSCVFR